MPHATHRPYTCSSCDEEFYSDRTDEEAMTESRLIWGDEAEDEQAIVCEECFKGILAWNGKAVGRA